MRSKVACLVSGILLLFVESSYADKSASEACSAFLRIAGKVLPYEESVAIQIRASLSRAQPKSFNIAGSNALVIARVIEKLSKNLAVRVEASELRGSQRSDFITEVGGQASKVLFAVAEGYFTRNQSSPLEQDQLVEKITRYTLRKLRPSPNELESKSQTFLEFRSQYFDQGQSLKIIDRVAPILIKKIRIRSKELFRSATSQAEGGERALARALGFVEEAIESGRQDPNTILRAVYSRMSDADYRQSMPLTLGSADLETKVRKALAFSSFSPRFSELLADRVLTTLRAIQKNSAIPIEDANLFSDIFEPERGRILKEAADISKQLKITTRWNVDIQKSVYERVERPLFVRAGRIEDKGSDLESFDQDRDFIKWAKRIVEARLDILGVRVRPALQNYLSVLQREASREALTFDSKDTKRLLDLVNQVLLETLADKPLEILSVMGAQSTLKEAILSNALRPRLELEIALAAASQSEPKSRNSRKQILIRKLWSMVENPFETSNEKRSELLGSFLKFGATQLGDSNLDPKVVNSLASKISGRMKIYFSPAIKLQLEALESFTSLYEDFPVEYAATINQLTSSAGSLVHVAYQRLRNRLNEKKLLDELNEKLKSIIAIEIRSLLFMKLLKAELPRNAEETEVWTEEIKGQILDGINPKIAELVEGAESESEQTKPAHTEIAKAPGLSPQGYINQSAPSLGPIIEILRSHAKKSRYPANFGRDVRDEFEAYLRSIPDNIVLSAGDEQLLFNELIRLENKIIESLSKVKDLEMPPLESSRLKRAVFIQTTLAKSRDENHTKVPESIISDFRMYEELEHLIVGNNLPLVVSIAKRKVREGLSLEDLVQLGNQGLIKSVRSFDPTKGFKLSSYATQLIINEISRFAQPDASLFKVGKDEKLRPVREAMNALANEGNPNPSPLEISARSGISLSLVISVLNRMKRSQSLDSTLNHGDRRETSLAAITPSNKDQTASRQLDTRDLLTRVHQHMEGLKDERARQVLIERNGLDGLPARTLGEIADTMGVNRERVRQIEFVGLRQVQGQLLLQEIWPNDSYEQLIELYYLSKKMMPDKNEIAEKMNTSEATVKRMLEELSDRIMQIGKGNF